MTPRPTSHSERSRSRSLISRRESSSSAAHDHRADSPVPEIPNTDGIHEEKPNGVHGTAHDAAGDAQHQKSPLLTAHRISVPSDMDDVSLEEGKFPAFQEPEPDCSHLRGTVAQHSSPAPCDVVSAYTG